MALAQSSYEAPVRSALYTNRGEPVRFRRGATTESSRGLQPTVEDQAVGVAERRLNGWQTRPLKRRSATRILASGNRGLKPTATVIQSLRDPDRKRSV